MLLRFAFFLFLLAHSIFSHAESGTYRNLLIGVDPITGKITGAFHEERVPPIGPSFSCIFAISGNIKEPTINVGFPGDKEKSRGEIRFEKLQGRSHVFIRLDEQQPGCAQTTPLEFLQGVLLELSRAKPWQAAMVVTAKKTYFHKEANVTSKTKSYVVYADCVGVLEIRGSWAKIEYENGRQSTIGWVPLRDLGAI